MKLTLNRRTALFITRAIRAREKSARAFSRRCELIAPDPAPRRRWTKSAIDLSSYGYSGPSARVPLDIAVSNQGARLKMRHAHSTVYESNGVLPLGSFVPLGDSGCCISCPELMFVEMGSIMSPAAHLMLGHELCGTFTRDPKDPRNGEATLHVPPITSTERIAEFVSRAKWIRGIEQARKTLELLSDNAWSPFESILVTMASLDFTDCGYALGTCIFNERVMTPDDLAPAAYSSSRVPDAIIENTHEGFNYDGEVHLDLASIVDAGIALGKNPEDETAQRELDFAMRGVRAKAVDDIRRDRELTADGYTIFTVVKEDLYTPGGLDRVMLQAINAIERETGRDMRLQRFALRHRGMRKNRQELLLSLLPGTTGHRPPADSGLVAPAESSVVETEILI